jgi:hypothetical protein
MHNDADKAAFRALFSEKEAIEQEFGEQLLWQELPTKKASRIALFRHGVDPADEAQCEDLHIWMLAKMERFQKVFGNRVKAVSLVSAPGAMGEDTPNE